MAQRSTKVLTPLISPLLDDTDPASLPHLLMIQTSAYRLLDKALPDRFGEHWLSVMTIRGLTHRLTGFSHFANLLIALKYLHHRLSPPNLSLWYHTRPHLLRKTLVGTLRSADCNDVLTASATARPCVETFTIPPLSTARRNTSAQHWVVWDLCPVFLFPSVLSGEEPLPIPDTRLIEHWHGK